MSLSSPKSPGGRALKAASILGLVLIARLRDLSAEHGPVWDSHYIAHEGVVQTEIYQPPPLPPLPNDTLRGLCATLDSGHDITCPGAPPRKEEYPN